MNEAFYELVGPAESGMLVVVDHASNRVPADVDLGIAPDLLEKHIAWDVGAAALGRALCERLDCPGLFGNVSRLVLDLHREPDSPGLIPAASDGHPIPGNQGLSAAEREVRLERFWRPYHARLAELVHTLRPDLILAVHSFTPRLEISDDPIRPWEIGILYNEDDRAARIAIAALRGAGLITGDNEPYSGKLLNATMNLHAEANGIPYLAIEVRNDLIAEVAGVIRWTKVLESVTKDCRNKLASITLES
jgi:predicted N-formylglutamate amidohydrolase